MQAIQVRAPGGYDHIGAIEMEDPGAPGAGEIRVRLHASSLNFHDYSVAMGRMGDVPARIPMADGAGVIEAIGAGVSEFKVGDHVVSCFYPDWQDGAPNVVGFVRVPGDGLDGYARETVVTPATWFTHAPGGWSHAEAATITTAGVTAWRALVVDGRIKAGDVVLVMGTGGVSIYALQMARAMGATVVATSSSDEKLERARALGADHVINYKAEPEWGAKVMALTGGHGADIVVEVGGAGTLPQSIGAVAMGGHISMIGVLTGVVGPVPTVGLLGKQAAVKGIIVGSRAHQRDMVKGMEATGIRPVIDKSFPLERIGDAFRHEESGAHFGKIVLEW